MSDHDLAAELATQAGKLLLDVRAELADASGAERKQRATSALTIT